MGLDNITVKMVTTKAGVWNNVYRPWEVLKRDAIWLLGKPVTVDHPHEGVSANTFMIGQIKNVEIDEENQQIICEAELWPDRLPPELLEKIQKDEKLDISVGFYAITDPVSGEFNGKLYTEAEKQIYFDHVAIVQKGECSAGDGCGINIMAKKCECNKDKVVKMTENKDSIDVQTQEEQPKKVYYVPKVLKENGEIKVQVDEAAEPPADVAQVLQQSVVQLLEELKDDLMQQIQALTEQNAQLTEALKKLTEEKQTIEEEAKQELLAEAAKLVPNGDVSVYKTMDRQALRQIITHMREIAQSHSEKTPIVITDNVKQPSLDDLHNQFDKMLGRKK